MILASDAVYALCRDPCPSGSSDLRSLAAPHSLLSFASALLTMATLKLSTTANVTSCRSKTMPIVRASYSAFRCAFGNVSTSSPSVGFDLANPELLPSHRLISRPNVNSTGKRLQQLSASTASPLPTLAPPATASADAGDASGTHIRTLRVAKQQCIVFHSLQRRPRQAWSVGVKHQCSCC